MNDVEEANKWRGGRGGTNEKTGKKVNI